MVLGAAPLLGLAWRQLGFSFVLALLRLDFCLASAWLRSGPCSASAWLRPGPGSASAWLRLSYAFSVFMHNEINRVLKEKVKNVLAVPGGN